MDTHLLFSSLSSLCSLSCRVFFSLSQVFFYQQKQQQHSQPLYYSHSHSLLHHLHCFCSYPDHKYQCQQRSDHHHLFVKKRRRSHEIILYVRLTVKIFDGSKNKNSRTHFKIVVSVSSCNGWTQTRKQRHSFCYQMLLLHFVAPFANGADVATNLWTNSFFRFLGSDDASCWEKIAEQI